jgi:exodeoxyribonuclease-3
MKIATWNVNSIRSRLDHVLTWWDAVQPDVLCLQETKVVNEDFPYEPFKQRGLQVVHHGQKAYNGVALISREAVAEEAVGFNGEDLEAQTRVVAGRVAGVRIVNLYVPQGQSVDSPKFDFKRRFYRALLAELQRDYEPAEPLVLCGDFNIAPAAVDVDDPAKREQSCMFTEEERGWLAELEAWGLYDALRLVTPEAGLFTWWDYRQLAFPKNRGMRIDLVYVTASLKEKVKGVDIYREERKKDKPSDHVPVVLTLG